MTVGVVRLVSECWVIAGSAVYFHLTVVRLFFVLMSGVAIGRV